MTAKKLVSDEDSKAIGQRIKQKRTELSISQFELGFRLATSGGVISKWETGFTMPSVANLRPLCAILKVSSDWLLGIEPGKEGIRCESGPKENGTAEGSSESNSRP